MNFNKLICFKCIVVAYGCFKTQKIEREISTDLLRGIDFMNQRQLLARLIRCLCTELTYTSAVGR